MKRRVWSTEEIEGVLLAANQANEMALAAAPGGPGEAMQHYRDGFVAALASLALAFGLRPNQTRGTDSPATRNSGTLTRRP